MISQIKILNCICVMFTNVHGGEEKSQKSQIMDLQACICIVVTLRVSTEQARTFLC